MRINQIKDIIMKNFIGSILVGLVALFIIDLVPILSPTAFFGFALAYAVVGVPAMQMLSKTYKIFDKGNGGWARSTAQALSLLFCLVLGPTFFNAEAMKVISNQFFSLQYGPASQIGLYALAFMWMLGALAIAVTFPFLAFADLEASEHNSYEYY